MRLSQPIIWQWNKGWRRACKENHELELGLNVVQGKVVYKPVAEAWGLPYEPLEL